MTSFYTDDEIVAIVRHLKTGHRIAKVACQKSGFARDAKKRIKRRRKFKTRQIDDTQPIVITGAAFCPSEAARSEVPW